MHPPKPSAKRPIRPCLGALASATLGLLLGTNALAQQPALNVPPEQQGQALNTPAIQPSAVPGKPLVSVTGRTWPAGTHPGVLEQEQCELAMQAWKQKLQAGMTKAQAGPAPECNLSSTPEEYYQKHGYAAPGQNTVQAAPAQQAQTVRTPPPEAGTGVPREDFARVFNSLLPLSATQIRDTHRHMDALDKAKADITRPAHIGNRAIKASLTPGSATPTIRLAAGYLTSLVFTDATGSPWPILQVKSGSPDFEVQEPLKGLRTNIASLAAMRSIATSNLLVFLEGAPAPLTLMVTAGEGSADGRVDIQVTSDSASSLDEMARGLAQTDPALPRVNDSPEMAQVLQGIVPGGLRPLIVRGPMSSHVQAWSSPKGDTIYLRTSMQIQSPAPIRAGRSVDGTHAYVIPRAEVVTFFDRGNTWSISILGLSSPLGAIFNAKAQALGHQYPTDAARPGR